MGIRFRCHHCEFELHVKDFQAGKRGRCPECRGRFRVPLADAPHSLDPEVELPHPTPIASQADVAPADAALDAKAKVAETAAKATLDAASTAVPNGPVTRADAASPAASAPASAGSCSPVPPPPPQSAPLPPALPRALQAAAEGNWHVRPPSGGQYGPAASSTMWQWLTENRVGRDSLVWTEGWPEWVSAESAFDDFFQASTLATAANIPPPQPAPAGKLRVGQVVQVDPNVRSEPAVATTAQAEPLLGDRNRAERKQKRRRNYALMIAGLAVVMLVLIATLIYVLGSQAS